MRRVVVTGLGCVSPVGNDVAVMWSNVMNGVSGIRKTSFDSSKLKVQIAGECNLDLTQYFKRKEVRRMDAFLGFGLVAAEQAYNDANITTCDPYRMGVVLGSGCGGISSYEKLMHTYLEKGPRMIPPTTVPSTIPNALSGAVAIRYNVYGPVYCPVAACATGSQAIGMAFRDIRNDYADVMIAGSSENAACEFGIAGFSAMRALAENFNDRPTEASRPFDTLRTGFVLSSGAAVVVLEELEHAQKRGAKIYGEVLGFDMRGGAADPVMLDPKSVEHCTNHALKDADLKPEDIDYINAHATSTIGGDEIEAQCINRIFSHRPYVSSTKGTTGHLLGAAGSLEFIITLLALKEKIVPPTLNLKTPDFSCGDMNIVRDKYLYDETLEVGMSNSFGFGATNACLIVRSM